MDGKGLRAGRRHLGIVLLVLAFLVLGTVYSVVTPLFEASDEVWHYPFVRHLAEGGGLPIQDPAAQGPWRQEGSQPPLYYALAALASRWVSAADLPQVLVRNPHADIGLLRPDGNANMMVHTSREALPYRGAVLAIHLARELSVVLGALTVLFAYLAGLEIFPQRPELALAGAAVAGFTPMFLFISGSVNNDNLLVTLSTAGLWLLLRLLREPPTPARWALLGAVIGLASLAKISGLGLLGPAALGLAWVAWRRRDWRLFLWDGACVAGAAAAVAGWWYYRNWRLYHDLLGLNVFVAIVGPRIPQPSLRQVLGEWKGFVMAYWGFFGGVNVAAPEWFYGLLDGLALLGLGGLVAGGVRAVWPRRRVATLAVGEFAASARLRALAARLVPDPEAAFRLFLVALWPLIVMVGLIRWTMMTVASQGRLLFPAIASLSYLLVLGLSAWVPRRWRALPPALAGSLMIALAVWVPFAVIAPAYARPLLLTPAQQAAAPQQLGVCFGDRMELLGYRIGAAEVRPGQGLAVTLYWRARAPMAEDYSVFVHLLTENELIVGQRDVYPGRGSFPTSLWQPGDAIADTYVIPVSPTAFSPSRAQVEVGLYRAETGERLPARDRDGGELGDNLRFGQVLVRAEPKDSIGNPLYINLGNKIALLGYDLDRTALAAGDTLHLTLYWKALVPLRRDYTVFAHVLGPNNSIWAQKDAWPQNGAAPTSSWRPGQVIKDSYDLVVKPETPGGVYEVEIGMYLGETQERLSILAPDGRLVDSRVLLNRVRVVRP